MITTCRSCGAPMEWATTGNGKPIPLDVNLRADGNIIVRDGRAYYVPVGDGDRVTHFATCPSAAEHRK